MRGWRDLQMKEGDVGQGLDCQCPVICAEEKCLFFWYLFPGRRGKMLEGGWHTNNNMQDNSLFQGLMFSPSLSRFFRTFCRPFSIIYCSFLCFGKVAKICFLKHFPDTYIASIETQLIHALQSCQPTFGIAIVFIFLLCTVPSFCYISGEMVLRWRESWWIDPVQTSQCYLSDCNLKCLTQRPI